MKTNIQHIALKMVALLAIFVLATSCQHKDLCYYHPHVAPIRVTVDWEKANGNAQYIEGMTAHLFAKQEMEQTINTTVTTHNVNEITFDLLEGNYSVAVFNSTPEEYSTLKFYDLGSFNQASVQVSETQVPWYSKYKVKSNDKFVAHQPEWIARGLVDDIHVTKEMVETAEQEYIDGGFLMGARTVTTAGEVVPDSLICNLKMRVLIKGIDNFYMARAVVSGLATGKQIISTEPLGETVSHYAGLESWKFVQESITIAGAGEIEGNIVCFGLPKNHRGLPEDNILTLEILLVDKKTIITSDPIPIGHLIGRDPILLNNLCMIEAVVYPVELPYVTPEDGTEGGFGVQVDDWEKEEVDILDH